jgi:hypothetical protein
MMTENIQALVTYRLERADESLEAARALLDNRGGAEGEDGYLNGTTGLPVGIHSEKN